MGKMTQYKTLLRDADIDAICGRIGQFLTENGQEEQEILRLRLTVKELLARVRDRSGWGTECILTLGSRFDRRYVRLSYALEPFDPTAHHRESDGEAWSARLLAELGVVPTWSWRRGVNRLTLHVRRKARSCFVGYGAAIAFAVTLGLAGGATDATWRETADRLVLTPLFDAFAGVLGAFSGWMVFFAVACGICAIGDTADFERTGKTMLGRFIGLTCLWSAVSCAVLSTLCGTLNFSGVRVERFLEWLYGTVPRDPISSLVVGDVRQIAFLAGFSGIVLLTLGDRARRVREWAEQCGMVLRSILERICALAPLFVFIALLRQIWRGSLASLLPLWKPLAVFVSGGLVIVGVKLLVTSLTLKMSVGKLAQTLYPTFLPALLTASSAAVFGKTMDNCEKRLGISHPLVLLGLPIGNLLCKPIAALGFGAVALYLAENCGAAVNVGWLAELVLLDAILCMVIPSVPGAFLTCFGLLLTQLGLPTEGLAVMLVLNVFFDALSTAYGNAYLQLELALQAKKIEK